LATYRSRCRGFCDVRFAAISRNASKFRSQLRKSLVNTLLLPLEADDCGFDDGSVQLHVLLLPANKFVLSCFQRTKSKGSQELKLNESMKVLKPLTYACR
jgi:hypothetical protein